MTMTPPVPTQVVVPVKSIWSSKTLWTQIIAAGAALLVVSTGGSLSISGEEQAAIVLALNIIQGLVTTVIKNYFTTSITPGSVVPPPMVPGRG
jgi:hypothetical protein